MNIEILVRALWSLPLVSVKNRYQVYFNFTSDVLRKIFSDFGIETNDIHGTINAAANEFLFVDSDRVYVLDKAFVPYYGNYSASIILVCQQVLIVEKMVDTEEFTSNAYFPWLRRAISKDLTEQSSTPFEYDEFERIWLTIYKETIHSGCDKRLIDLEFGKKKGADQSKRFPLSQALLSKEDCLRIIEEIGQVNIQKLRNQNVLQLAIQEKSCLTKRGRRIISTPWLQDGVASQIKAYSASSEIFRRYQEEVKAAKIETSNLILKAYLDSSGGWLGNQMALGVFNSETDNRISESKVVSAFIIERVFDKGFTFFPFSSDNDCWVLSKERVQIMLKSKVLVTFTDQHEDEVRVMINAAFDGSVAELKKKKFSKISELNYFLFYPKSLVKTDAIANGKLLVQERIKGRTDLSLEGGITLDAKGEVYSPEHLPQFLIANGRRIVLAGTVKVNNQNTTFEFFRISAKTMEGVIKFKVEIQGIEFSLVVAGKYLVETNITYPVVNGKVVPVSSRYPETREKLITLGEVFEDLRSPHQIYGKLLSLKREKNISGLRNLLESLQ